VSDTKIEKALRENTEKYINQYANLLNIAGYTIQYDFVDRRGKREYGNVAVHQDDLVANIQLNAAKILEEPDQLERTVLHECLHILFWPYYEEILDIIDEYVPDKHVRKVLMRGLSKLEHVIIAKIIKAILGRNDEISAYHGSGQRYRRVAGFLLRQTGIDRVAPPGIARGPLYARVPRRAR